MSRNLSVDFAEKTPRIGPLNLFSSIEVLSSRYLTKTHNWVEWTAPSVSLLQTKVNDINLNDRPQMQNDTENEIGRSLFPFIHGLRILISFDYLHQSHAVKIS